MKKLILILSIFTLLFSQGCYLHARISTEGGGYREHGDRGRHDERHHDEGHHDEEHHGGDEHH